LELLRLEEEVDKNTSNRRARARRSLAILTKLSNRRMTMMLTQKKQVPMNRCNSASMMSPLPSER
jgi:uncharacterized protein YacL